MFICLNVSHSCIVAKKHHKNQDSNWRWQPQHCKAKQEWRAFSKKLFIPICFCNIVAIIRKFRNPNCRYPAQLCTSPMQRCVAIHSGIALYTPWMSWHAIWDSNPIFTIIIIIIIINNIVYHHHQCWSSSAAASFIIIIILIINNMISHHQLSTSFIVINV